MSRYRFLEGTTYSRTRGTNHYFLLLNYICTSYNSHRLTSSFYLLFKHVPDALLLVYSFISGLQR